MACGNAGRDMAAAGNRPEAAWPRPDHTYRVGEGAEAGLPARGEVHAPAAQPHEDGPRHHPDEQTRRKMAMMGSWKIGTVGLQKGEDAEDEAGQGPTIGPSSTPPTIAGMCMIVALPMSGIGTGMKPSRVTPRNSAMPPMMPATTICLVSESGIWSPAPRLRNPSPFSAPSAVYCRTSNTIYIELGA